MTVSELRQKTASELEGHTEQYLPFLSMSRTEFSAYCVKMASTAAWGGQVELLALSRVLDRPIEVGYYKKERGRSIVISSQVIQAEGPSTVMGDGGGRSSVILTYHRHMFGLGEHYNSVTRL